MKNHRTRITDQFLIEHIRSVFFGNRSLKRRNYIRRCLLIFGCKIIWQKWFAHIRSVISQVQVQAWRVWKLDFLKNRSVSREEIVLDISSLFFRKKSPDARFCALFNRILCLKRTGEKIYPVVDNEAFYVISQNARQRKRRFPRSISLLRVDSTGC